jgi:pimeloyl-ACP methyl ester carboxylesterase
MDLEHVAEGQGPVVVLLHGFPLNRAIWDDQRAALSRDFRVVVPDLPGMGASPVVSDATSMDDMADEVIDLLDSLAVEGHVTVGGLSMGGYVVLSLMERHPERLSGAILVDTRADADSPEAAANRRALASDVEASGSLDKVVNSFLPKVLGKTTHSERPALVERVRQIMGSTTPLGAAACLRGMAGRPDRRGVLPRFQRPALVIVGEEDTLTPPDEAREMASALPSSRLELIPRAGHLSCMENPAAVTAAIQSFLKTLA